MSLSNSNLIVPKVINLVKFNTKKFKNVNLQLNLTVLGLKMDQEYLI